MCCVQSLSTELLRVSSAELETGRVREQVWSASEIPRHLLVISNAHCGVGNCIHEWIVFVDRGAHGSICVAGVFDFCLSTASLWRILRCCWTG